MRRRHRVSGLAGPPPARLSPDIESGDVRAASQSSARAGRVFVGRERELAEIDAAVAEARGGRVAFTLVSGEAGIGKTRLAEAAAERARELGFRVYWGRSWESEGSPPFWPWVQVLRACVREVDDDELSSCADGVLAHVAELVPEIRSRRTLTVPAPAPADSEESRFARFDAIATFLAHATRERPFLIVLDDVHWADRSSVGLLEFLAQGFHGLPLLVLATYRDPGGAPSGLDASADARLLRLGRHLALRGFSESEVETFVAETGGAKPLTSFVAALHDATRGNPFFIVEVLRLHAAEPADRQLAHAMAESFPIPHSVRATIRKRVALLPDAARPILEAAAVIGREFEVALLEDVCERGQGELLDVLGHALRAGVITAGRSAPLTYAFFHGLVRETLYDDVAPARRAELHRRVGEAIETVHAGRLDDRYAALAHHFARATVSAVDVAKAVEYSRRAAERALALFAYDEAIDRYERGLALLDTPGAGDEHARQDLLCGLGEVLWWNGLHERAVAVYDEAAAIAETLGDAERLARAALGVASPYATPPSVTGIFHPTSLPLLEKSVAALPRDDSPLRARVMARLSLELSLHDELERSAEVAREATAMARRLADDATLVEVLTWAGEGAVTSTADLSVRTAVAAEIGTLAESLLAKGFGSYTQYDLVAGFGRIAVHHERGEIDEARHEWRRLQDRMKTLAARNLRGEGMLTEAQYALLEGRFGEAERIVEQAFTEEGRYLFVQMVGPLHMLFIRREQARIAEVAGFIESTAATAKSPGVDALVAWMLAEAERLPEARTLFDELAKDDFRAAFRHWSRSFARGILAEIACFLEDRKRGAILYELLLPFADRAFHVMHAWNGGPIARPLGKLATLLGKFDEAERHFEAALAMCDRMRARPWLAWAQHDYARMLLARDAAGDRERALALLDQSAGAAREMGMTLLTERATALREPFGAPAGPGLEAAFQLNGDRWSIRYRAPTFQLKDGKGLQYLGHLLRHPGQEFHVADLVAVVGGRSPTAPALGDTGEILDSRARAEYRERLKALEDDLEEASARNDAGRSEMLREEMEFVKQELAAAYGLGGRVRRGGDVIERMRKAVTNRIRDAIGQIERHDPELAEHLSAAVRTGKFCSYDPADPVHWRI